MDYLAQIKEHALKLSPRECCGVVIRRVDRLEAVPLPNIAAEPERAFLMAPRDYLPYITNKSLVEYYHSHPKEDAILSDEDIKISESSGYPVRVYSIPTDKFATYSPKGHTFSLEGRRFSLGVFDCYTLVVDYYVQVLGIELAPFQVTPQTITDGLTGLMFLIQERGLRMIPVSPEGPKKHDIIFMGIGSSLCNHVGVYLGDSVMLHQTVNSPSRRVVYGSSWAKHTICYARHPSFI